MQCHNPQAVRLSGFFIVLRSTAKYHQIPTLFGKRHWPISGKQHKPPLLGEVLKDGVFTDSGITVKQFAERLGVTRVALSRVLNGRAAFSPEMALRLADALGDSAESWLHLQANYHL